jgi:hypothetical protein
MISFKQYLLEFGDINAIMSNDIELEKTEDGYEYNFGKHKIYMMYDEMHVLIGKWPMQDAIKILDKDHCYLIGLTYDNRYAATNAGNEFNVYATVFKAMKKFLEIANPEGIKFSGVSSEMDILYNKFYRKFLSPTFMKIDWENYIKKSVFQTLPEEHKKIIESRMSGRDWEKDIEDKIKNKNDFRNRRIAFKKSEIANTEQLPQ